MWVLMLKDELFHHSPIQIDARVRSTGVLGQRGPICDTTQSSGFWMSGCVLVRRVPINSEGLSCIGFVTRLRPPDVDVTR